MRKFVYFRLLLTSLSSSSKSFINLCQLSFLITLSRLGSLDLSLSEYLEKTNFYLVRFLLRCCSRWKSHSSKFVIFIELYARGISERRRPRFDFCSIFFFQGLSRINDGLLVTEVDLNLCRQVKDKWCFQVRVWLKKTFLNWKKNLSIQ